MKIKPATQALSLTLGLAALLQACASAQLPEEHHERYTFPPYRVYIEEPTGKAVGMPYQILGWVRARVSFPTMEQAVNNPMLCKNYFNKGAKDLLKEADKVNADAVIKVRSVVYNIDGTTQDYPSPECSDDGAEGEILMRGIAIKFGAKPLAPGAVSPLPPVNLPVAKPTPAKGALLPVTGEGGTASVGSAAGAASAVNRASGTGAPARSISSVTAPSPGKSEIPDFNDGRPSSEHH